MNPDEKALVARLDDHRNEGVTRSDVFHLRNDAAALVRRQSSEIEMLARALVAFAGKRQSHYECEDAWYSCPKHESYAKDDGQTECNCGADDHNAYLDSYAPALAIAKERA